MSARVLLWTRDLGARETIPLVLARMGRGFARCDSAEELAARVQASDRPLLVLLGPSFAEAEARALAEHLRPLAPHAITVVLLEDLAEECPHAHVLIDTADPARIRLPVRPRSLRELVEAWEAASKRSAAVDSRP